MAYYLLYAEIAGLVSERFEEVEIISAERLSKARYPLGRGPHTDLLGFGQDGIDELVFFEKRWHAFHHNHDLRVLVGTILANEALWGEDLTLMPGMVDMVTARLQSILTLGIRETVENLVK